MNMNWDAAFAACKSYDDTEVSAALQTAVDAAGGLDWVTPGMRVALKLNLVSAMKPEQAATVHPAVVCALVRMLTARGAHVILGDSPGGLYTSAHLQRVCGPPKRSVRNSTRTFLSVPSRTRRLCRRARSP